MVDKEKIQTTVIDAGGRYGLHPSWKPFKGELAYYLFEPDPEEAERLKQKYQQRQHEITIEQMGLDKESGELQLNLFRNRAMSSSSTRNPISSLFHDEREQEVEITKTITVPTISIDEYARDKNLQVDFLKLDTEGSEYEILQGAQEQVTNHILGIRCEVAFDYIFEGRALFPTLHEHLLERDYFLLNLDYDGRGDYQNESVQVEGRYGILTACDAVWLKRYDYSLNTELATEVLAINAMKLAAFCLENNATDVGIDILLKVRKDNRVTLQPFEHSKLYKYLDKKIHELFYGLKWQPGQSLLKNQQVYHNIFEKEMKVMNEYMESLTLNPD